MMGTGGRKEMRVEGEGVPTLSDLIESNGANQRAPFDGPGSMTWEIRLVFHIWHSGNNNYLPSVSHLTLDEPTYCLFHIFRNYYGVI
jgi:hypothetical protein